MHECTKVSYASKRQANQAAYAIKAKGKIAPREGLYEYFCTTCKTWHISGKKPRPY